MNANIKKTVYALVTLISLVLSRPALAQEPTAFSSAKREFTFLSGYGTSHRGFGKTETQVQTLDFIGRYGYFLTEEIGDGWYRGRFEHLLELPLHLVVDPRTRIMTGGYLLASWKFSGLKEKLLYPYIFGGGGILYVDLGLPSMGSRLDFSYQGGTGLQYFVRQDLAVLAEYRYHHISNAGTATPNEPLNSSKFLLGISFYR
ncbi:MAG TPA: acyloxyacyl hydrolase [Desulfuromonadaceae bacterium]|jgi:hypothetical protein